MRSYTHESDLQFNNNLSLYFIYKYKIAKAFSPGSTITFDELSRKTDAPLHDLKRLLRHAMVSGGRIFCEPTKDTVAHTAASRLLATDARLDAWTGLLSEDIWGPACDTVSAMIEWPHSQDPTHTGFQKNLGEKKHFFEILSADQERMKRFSLGMEDLSTGGGFEAQHLASGYNWSQFGSPSSPGRVVDVGGSLGFASAAIAAKHDNISFTVQDLPHVLANDPGADLPANVRDRIEFMPHNFFEEQPVRGADAYLFRWCMHNWSDEQALKILRALVPAMKRGARVIINDSILPEPNTLGPSWRDRMEVKGKKDELEEEEEEINAEWEEEKSIRTIDLVMLSVLNAKERDIDGWKALFREASEGFVWMSAQKPDGCKMWIIEVAWEG